MNCVLDYHLPRDKLVRQVAAASAEYGFFQLRNVPLPTDTVAHLGQTSAAFFQLPATDKNSLTRTAEMPWGFYDRELTKNVVDRKEIFDFSPSEPCPWPAQLPEFRNALAAFTERCHSFALELLAILCEGQGWKPDSLSPYFCPEHSSFTRLNYYPASVGENPQCFGPWGISEHTDAGALTLLWQDEVSALQMWHDGWHDVEPNAGCVTVNIGDMLQVWSNDSYVAPLHRVKASGEHARFSSAYFLNPGYKSVVQPFVPGGAQPHYRPISWREFRGLRAQGDYGDYGEEVQISHYKLTETKE